MSLNIMEKAAVMAPLANFPPPISETVPPKTALAVLFDVSKIAMVFPSAKI